MTQATAVTCVPRADWVPYIVQPGDTLFSISRRSGVSLAEMQRANCIADPSKIYFGQVIVVPPGSPLATPGNSGGPVGTGTTSCSNPAARITAPFAGASLRGVVQVLGTANIPDFSFYKLEVRADSSAAWNNFAQAKTPVNNSILGSLNTELFPPGIYWIQLTVVDNTGNYPILPCAIRVRFE